MASTIRMRRCISISFSLGAVRGWTGKTTGIRFAIALSAPMMRARRLVRGVHVGRAMQGEDSILPRRQAVWQRQLTGTVDLLAQSIDHGIANEIDFLASDTFVPQILLGQSIGCEQKVRNGIGAEAVDLFRHGHVP